MIGPFVDYPKNPILAPAPGLPAKALFNPGVILDKGLFYMLYRVQSPEDNLTGRIMLAQSEDGFQFSPLSDPVIVPEHDYEKFGCEDPRVVKFNDTFYLTYNGAYTWSKELKYCSQACLAISKDLKHWEKLGPIFKPYQGTWCGMGHKSAAVVPVRLNSGYVMYFEGRGIPGQGEERIGIAYSQDLIHWEADLSAPVLLPRKDYFDSKGVEPGCALVTDEGILLVYNGWDWNSVFRPGWALFSWEEPNRLIARCTAPLLDREEEIIFTEALVPVGNQWLLYYGLDDKVINLAISEGRV